MIRDLAELCDRAPVFADRAAAGRALARLLDGYRASGAEVIAIPAGGVPVAAEIAALLGLALDVAPVSKMLLPWTTESGFGAVAFDGSVWMDPDDVRRFGLSEADIERAAAQARARSSASPPSPTRSAARICAAARALPWPTPTSGGTT